MKVGTTLGLQSYRSPPIRVGIVGSGHFATAVVTQSASIDWLHVIGIAERNPEKGIEAFEQAGFRREEIFLSSQADPLADSVAAGRPFVTDQVDLLLAQSLDIIVESTGNAEAGALHAQMAIDAGIHVAMVTKEADAVVGPILAHRARERGVVYTAVAGDQHGLLIELVEEMRLLGLRILCAGKARDAELDLDPETDSPLAPQKLPLQKRTIEERINRLGAASRPGGWDLSELVIAANALGLRPDRLVPDGSGIHCPPLYVPEIPQVLAPLDYGGILSGEGVIEAVTALRSPGAGGMGGGVFVVVEAASAYSTHILATKGCLTGSDGRAALIYRPYHLCGVETPLTLGKAVAAGEGYYTDSYQPRIDLVMRTRRPMQAGERIGTDHSPDLEPLLAPAAALTPDALLPLHLGTGLALQTDLPAGAFVRVNDVAAPSDSVLWSLRREQDRRFGSW